MPLNSFTASNSSEYSIMFDDDPRPANQPAAHLLDELESIKGVLTDDHATDAELPTDIPLLDDMVIQNLDNNVDLLNIDRIFDEDTTTDEISATTAQPIIQFPRFTLDVAITDDSEIAAAVASNSPISVPPISTPSGPAMTTRVRPDYSREVLIQELIDEFIPQIEAELQKRLQQLDDTALRRLKNSQ